MKHIQILLVLVFSSLSVFSQTFLGVFIEPSIQFSAISDAPEMPADSLRNLNEPDFNLRLGAEVRITIDRFNSISIIPSYQQLSSLYVKEDLQFLDVVHPALPEIRDLSQAAIKNAYIHDRFKYAGLHLIYNRSVSDRFKSIGTIFEVNGGVSYHYLLKQDAKIVTEGFAIQGKFKHVVTDSLFFEGNKHNVSLNLGGGANYNFSANWYVFGNAMLRIPLLATSTNDPRLTILPLGFKAGIRYALDQ